MCKVLRISFMDGCRNHFHHKLWSPDPGADPPQWYSQEHSSALTFLYHNLVIYQLVIENPRDLHTAAIEARVCFPGVQDGQGHVPLGQDPLQLVPAALPLCHPPAICPDNGLGTLGIGALVPTPAHGCDVLCVLDTVEAGHSDVLTNLSNHSWFWYCGAWGQKDKRLLSTGQVEASCASCMSWNLPSLKEHQALLDPILHK